MIELTVKTLDSVNHSFKVDDDTTVAQLKERIREALGFELNNQRLIFCGRVLNDEQVLKEAGIDSGKCLHLVERPPPSPTSRRRDRDRMEGGHGGDNQGRDPNQHGYTIRIGPRQQMRFMSPTAGRLNSIRSVIIEIRATLAALTLRAGDLVARRGPEASGRSGNHGTANMETDSTDETHHQAGRSRRPRVRIPENPQYPSSPHDLGTMIEELDYLHNVFAPFREEYVAMLRNLTMQNYTEAERRQRQDVVRLICDIMHSFAHCYHSISDITFNVGRRSQRLNSESPSTTRNAQPVQAQINFIAAAGPRSMSGDRRGASAGSAAAAATTATTTTGETATATTANGGGRTNVSATRAPPSQASTPRPAAPPPAAPTEPATTSDTIDVCATTSTVCTPVHTTTCNHARLDRSTPSTPIEIETRGDIPIPEDNNTLSGSATAASNFTEAFEQHQRAIRNAGASQATEAALGASRSLPIRVPPSNRRRQNLPPGLIALDNLDSWGSVGRAALIAAEARMSATEASAPSTPSPSAPAAPAAQTASGSTFLGSAPINVGPRSAPVQGANSGAGHVTVRASRPLRVRGSHTGHAQMHIAGISRLSDQTNDGSRPRVLMDVENMMRNLAENVGMEVVMSMEEIPNLFPTAGHDADVRDQVYVSPLYAAHNAGGTPTADLLQNILAIVRNRLMAQNQGQSHNRGQGQAQNQGQSPNQGSVQSNAERRTQWQAPWGGPRRRADNQYPFDPTCLEYDRFLDCDSVYAREQLQARRSVYRAQADAEQQQESSIVLPDIGEITNRNSRFTPVHMLTMTRLLNDPGSEQGQLNAVMLIIAREIFLQPENPRDTSPSARGPVPNEFNLIRVQLSNYVHGQMGRSAARGRNRDPFEAFAERLIARAGSFLTEIPSIERRAGDSTIGIDPNQSFRAFMAERLPTVIAWLMTDIYSEIVAVRLYTVVYSFYADLCTMFMSFVDDYDRLVRIYDDFIGTITEDYGSSTRDWLRVLCHENIVGIRPYMETNMNVRRIRQFFRQVNGSAVPAQFILPVMREDHNVMRYRSFLGVYCASHLQQVRPLQAPLLPSQSSSSDDDSSKTSTPTTTKSRRRYNPDQNEESDSDNQASGPDAGSEERSQDSSAAGSPSHSRSEPQADVESEEESDSETSTAETVPSGESPRRLRRWGHQSPTDSQSLASDLTSESHPPGIMAIPPGPDTDSLCDVEELDVEAIVDDVDPYVCEYTTVRKAVVYKPLNIIEDDTDDEVNEDDEVDIETVEDDSTLVADDLEIRMRREKRERSIRRDVARRRLEGDIRHKRFITLHETEERLDRRDRHLANWQKNYNKRLIVALERVVEKRRRLEEQGLSTDEEVDEISENESSEEENMIEDNSTTRSNPELERMLRQREIMLAKIEFSSRDPSLHATLRDEHAALYQAGETDIANRMAILMREMGFIDNEPGEPILGPQPGHSANNPPPVLVPESNDAVKDGNDFESDDESNNEYLSPIHREAPADQKGPVQDADDDWYSLPSYRSPFSELDNDGYYSPQLSMYHERPGFLTPQPRAEQVVLQTPQHTRKHHKKQATEIADSAQTNNAEAGRKDIPHTSDDLNLATAPMDGIVEEDMRSIMGRWEPVLREDSAAQARGGRTQPPFSDAYISGMPARKRRCLQEERPVTRLNQFINDGLRGVSEGVPGGLRGGDVELTQLLRESVRDLVAARVRDEPEDFDPTRFPNTAAFLANADSTMTKEPEEKNPTPPKSDAPDSVE